MARDEHEAVAAPQDYPDSGGVEPAGPARKGGPPPVVWIAIAVVIGFGVMLLMSGPSEPPSNTGTASSENGEPQASSDTGDDADRDRPQDREGPAFNPQGASGNKALATFAKEVSDQQKQIRALQQQLKSLEAQARERDKKQERDMNRKLQEVTDALQELNRQLARQDYSSGLPGQVDTPASTGGASAPPLPSEDLDEGLDEGAPGEDGAGQARQQDRGTRYGYLALYSGKRRTAAGRAANPDAAGEDQFAGAFDDGDSGGADSGSSEPGEESSDEDEGAEREDIEVAVGSFADGVLLHGLDCPVGGQRGGRGDDLFSSTPAIMQLRTPFKQPNGTTVSLGEAHLTAMCVGIRNGQRARLRIDRLSYVDDEGTPHAVDADGYVSDNSPGDQAQDVQGVLISQKGSATFAASTAEGIQAVSDILVEKQFTQTQSSEGDTTSSFDGDSGELFAGAFSSGVANRIADMMLSDIEASRDVIHVPAGTKIKFHTLSPIVVPDAREANSES